MQGRVIDEIISLDMDEASTDDDIGDDTDVNDDEDEERGEEQEGEGDITMCFVMKQYRTK